MACLISACEWCGFKRRVNLMSKTEIFPKSEDSRTFLICKICLNELDIKDDNVIMKESRPRSVTDSTKTF